MVFKRRQDRLRDVLAESGQRAFLLNSENDIFYYTGFRVSGSSMLLVSPRSTRLFVSRLEGDAEKLRTARVVVTDKKPGPILRELAKYGSVGFDEESLKTGTYLELKKGVKLKPASEWIKKPRQVKGPGEIALMKRAADLTRGVFRLRLTGRAESAVAREIEKMFFDSGAGEAFPPIVSSGRDSAVIHHMPGKRKIRARDLVIVDAGARVGGYCADFTRTFCSNPRGREGTLMENIWNIHDMVLDAARPGVKYADLTGIYEKGMKRHGYKVQHSIGHGIGLDAHEPFPEILQENNVITIEPGAYIRGFGGCRIENTVLIKGAGGRIL